MLSLCSTTELRSQPRGLSYKKKSFYHLEALGLLKGACWAEALVPALESLF
jgi:hypothetical protein